MTSPVIPRLADQRSMLATALLLGYILSVTSLLQPADIELLHKTYPIHPLPFD